MKEHIAWKFPRKSTILTVTFDQHLGLFAVGFKDGNIQVREFPYGRQVASWKGHNWVTKSLMFLSHNEMISGSLNEIKRWKWNNTIVDEKSDADSQADVEIEKKPKAEKQLTYVDFVQKVWETEIDTMNPFLSLAQTGDHLLVGCNGGRISVLDINSGQQIQQYIFHSGWVNSIIPLGHLYGNSFLSSSSSGLIRLQLDENLSEPERSQLDKPHQLQLNVLNWRGDREPVTCLALSPCGEKVAVGCGSEYVHLYYLKDWKLIWKEHISGTKGTTCLQFSPNGQFLVVGGRCINNYEFVRVVYVDTGRHYFKHFRTGVMDSIFFSLDGFKLIFSSNMKCSSYVIVKRLCDKDDRIASLLRWVNPSDVPYQGHDVFARLFSVIRQKLLF